MSITININNLSLCHKASGGVTMATLPDICKTPTAGGQPVPYPNVAVSTDVAAGTATVSADGGNMCANYGSQFSKSTGDELGTLGGITSGTFMKEASWITYSFDVKLEGQGACRLTDKMFHNHQNTVNMAGLIQPPVGVVGDAADIAVLCAVICECIAAGTPTQAAVEDRLTEMDDALAGGSFYKPEVAYNMGQSPPAHIPKDWHWPEYKKYRFFRDPSRPLPWPIIQSNRDYGWSNAKGMIKIPDVTVLKNPYAPPAGNNIRSVFEIKMPFDSNPLGSANAADQMFAYERIANQDGANPDGKVIPLDAAICGCKPPTPVPVPVPVAEPAKAPAKEPHHSFWGRLAGAGKVLAGATVVVAATAATVLLVADDATGIGVADDPLLIGTAGGMALGGRLAAGGAAALFAW